MNKWLKKKKIRQIENEITERWGWITFKPEEASVFGTTTEVCLWDFQTALGDTIKEKYKDKYKDIKIIEIRNLR